MSRDRGIIFQGWGVLGIRNMEAGVWPPKAIDPSKPMKPMTRRTRDLDEVNERPDDWRFQGWSSLKEGVAIFSDMAASKPSQIEIKCPYGIAGDGLWVRETCKLFGVVGTRNTPATRPVQYKADGAWAYPAATERFSPVDTKWRPSIHMFRWASREDLVVKEVRVERVQEISEEDAKAEGVTFDGTYWLGGTHPVKGTLQCWPTARRAFQAIWDEINKARGFGWDANPWNWALSYMRT